MWSRNEYIWNAGIFVWRVDAILAALQLLPDLYRQLRTIEANGGPTLPDAFRDVWGDIGATTNDYGVMERADVAIIPVNIEQSDVGDWDTLTGLALEANEPEQLNVVHGDHIGFDIHDMLVYSDAGHLIATIGLDDFIVVDTGDAVLIAARQRAQDIKRIVYELRARSFRPALIKSGPYLRDESAVGKRYSAAPVTRQQQKPVTDLCTAEFATAVLRRRWRAPNLTEHVSKSFGRSQFTRHRGEQDHPTFNTTADCVAC